MYEAWEDEEKICRSITVPPVASANTRFSLSLWWHSQFDSLSGFMVWRFAGVAPKGVEVECDDESGEAISLPLIQRILSMEYATQRQETHTLALVKAFS